MVSVTCRSVAVYVRLVRAGGSFASPTPGGHLKTLQNHSHLRPLRSGVLISAAIVEQFVEAEVLFLMFVIFSYGVTGVSGGFGEVLWAALATTSSSYVGLLPPKNYLWLAHKRSATLEPTFL